MTNELEKQFFQCFGIEPRLDCKKCGAKNFALGQCWEVNCEKSYPQITDRILLELICILAKMAEKYWYEAYRVVNTDYQDLKETILDNCICFREHIKHQVRTLFEEGEDNEIIYCRKWQNDGWYDLCFNS